MQQNFLNYHCVLLYLYKSLPYISFERELILLKLFSKSVIHIKLSFNKRFSIKIKFLQLYFVATFILF